MASPLYSRSLRQFYRGADKVFGRLQETHAPDAALIKTALSYLHEGWASLDPYERDESLTLHHQSLYQHYLACYLSACHDKTGLAFLYAHENKSLASATPIAAQTYLVDNRHLEPAPQHRRKACDYPIARKTALFREAAASGLLQHDIRTLECVTTAFTLCSKDLQNAYIHKDAYQTVTDFAATILSEKKIMLDKPKGLGFYGMEQLRDTNTMPLVSDIILHARPAEPGSKPDEKPRISA